MKKKQNVFLKVLSNFKVNPFFIPVAIMAFYIGFLIHDSNNYNSLKYDEGTCLFSTYTGAFYTIVIKGTGLYKLRAENFVDYNDGFNQVNLIPGQTIIRDRESIDYQDWIVQVDCDTSAEVYKTFNRLNVQVIRKIK